MLDFGFYNEDCLPRMKEYPDDFFDLAIVDPPYGGSVRKDEIGTHFHGRGRSKKYKEILIDCERTGGAWFEKYKSADNKVDIKEWDVAPTDEYFEELFRISRNQIIWGGNYFELPPTRCFVVWKKLSISENFTMSMCEYAWTSFNDNAKIFEHAPQDSSRFHPTQKPVALYKWLLQKYAKEGDTILDTHVGSASSLIACEELGFKYVGFEISEAYYKLAIERIDKSVLSYTDYVKKYGKKGRLL